ncbi:MAG: hypothetical protein OEY11_14530 [Gammaproteobacteria bacterium]|nr:hypothetical protein [Gammaproteobacteria bacterium]
MYISTEWSAESIAALDSGETEFYQLLFMDLSTPLYYTSAPYNVTGDDGVVWLSSADITGWPKSYTDSLGLNSSSISINMAGAPLANQVLPLTENATHKSVMFYYYLPATGQAVPAWQGTINNVSSEEDNQAGKSTIKWEIDSHATGFDDVRGRVLTDKEQQRLHPGDTGFKYVGKIEAALSSWNSDDDSSSTGWSFLDGTLDVGSQLLDKVSAGLDNAGEDLQDLWDSVFGGGGGSSAPAAVSKPEPKIDDFKNNMAKLPSSRRRLQVVYGRDVAVKPEMLFISTDPDNTNVLYIGYLLCEGAIGGIVDIQFEGDSYLSSRYASNVTLLDSTLGTDTQPASAALIAKFPTLWTAADQCKGCATMVIQYTAGDMFSGQPEPLVIIDGREVYDPRTGVTASSANPFLNMRDYAMNPLFGRGLPQAMINDQATIEAANLADVNALDHDGSGTGTYSSTPESVSLLAFNGVISTDDTLKSNLNKMLFCGRAKFPWINGRYEFVTEKAGEVATATFTDKDIQGPVKFSRLPAQKKYNRVYYSFIDPRYDYLVVPVPVHSDAYLAIDNNVPSVYEIANPFENNAYRAENRADTILKVSRSDILLGFKAASAGAIKVKQGDMIKLTLESKGWVNKSFYVGKKITQSNADVALALKEYTSTDYDWAVSVEDVPPEDTYLIDNVHERTEWNANFGLDAIHYHTDFDSIGGFNKQNTSHDEVAGHVSLIPNVTDAFITRSINNIHTLLIWSKKRSVRFTVSLHDTVNRTFAPNYIYVGIGNPSGTNFIGLRIEAYNAGLNYITARVMAKNASGTTVAPSAVNLTATRAGPAKTVRFIEVELILSSDKLVMRNVGSQTITTNLPTGTIDADMAVYMNVPVLSGLNLAALTSWTFMQHRV